MFPINVCIELRFSSIGNKMEQLEIKAADLHLFVSQLSDCINDKQSMNSESMPSNTKENPRSVMFSNDLCTLKRKHGKIERS